MNVNLSQTVLFDLHRYYKVQVMLIRRKIKNYTGNKELMAQEEVLRTKFDEVTKELYRIKVIKPNIRARQILGKRMQNEKNIKR